MMQSSSPHTRVEIPFECDVFQLLGNLQSSIEGAKDSGGTSGYCYETTGQLWDKLPKLDSAVSAECDMINRKLQLQSYEQKLKAMGETFETDMDQNLDMCEARITHAIPMCTRLHAELSAISASIASLCQTAGQLQSFNCFLAEFISSKIPAKLQRLYNLSMFVIREPKDVMKDNKESRIILRFLLSSELARPIKLQSFQNGVIRLEQLEDFKERPPVAVPALADSPIRIDYQNSRNHAVDFPEFINDCKGNFFAKIEVKKLVRTEKIAATEDNCYCFLFIVEVNLFGKSHVIWKTSAPFILASNIVKYPCPFNNFWMYNFEQCPSYLMPAIGITIHMSPETGQYELHVGWVIFMAKLRKKFESVVQAGVSLPCTTTEYFGQKLFGKCYGTKPWSELTITKKKVAEDKFYTEDGKVAKVSFWEWFQQCCLLLKPRKQNTNHNFHEEFKARIIYGFISKNKAEQFIRKQKEPCFIIRFRESQLKSLDICYNTAPKKFEHLVVEFKENKKEDGPHNDCCDLLNHKCLVHLIQSHDRLKRLHFVIGPDHNMNKWRINIVQRSSDEATNNLKSKIKSIYTRLNVHERAGSRYVKGHTIYKAIRMEVAEISVKDPYWELKEALDDEFNKRTIEFIGDTVTPPMSSDQLQNAEVQQSPVCREKQPYRYPASIGSSKSPECNGNIASGSQASSISGLKRSGSNNPTNQQPPADLAMNNCPFTTNDAAFAFNNIKVSGTKNDSSSLNRSYPANQNNEPSIGGSTIMGGARQVSSLVNAGLMTSFQGQPYAGVTWQVPLVLPPTPDVGTCCQVEVSPSVQQNQLGPKNGTNLGECGWTTFDGVSPHVVQNQMQIGQPCDLALGNTVSKIDPFAPTGTNCSVSIGPVAGSQTGTYVNVHYNNIPEYNSSTPDCMLGHVQSRSQSSYQGINKLDMPIGTIPEMVITTQSLPNQSSGMITNHSPDVPEPASRSDNPVFVQLHQSNSSSSSTSIESNHRTSATLNEPGNGEGCGSGLTGALAHQHFPTSANESDSGISACLEESLGIGSPFGDQLLNQFLPNLSEDVAEFCRFDMFLNFQTI